MAELTSMMNIGKEMARKLSAVGIHTPEQLIDAGSKEAFSRMKVVFPQVCLVHLYVLEGAILSAPYNCLPEDKRLELKEFSDRLKDRP